MTWAVLIANRAKRQLRRLSLADRDEVDFALDAIRDDPYGGDIKYLRGTEGVIRRRAGDWRILYELDRQRRLIMVFSVQRRSSKTY